MKPLPDSWTDAYVGIPWVWRGLTREGVDCYGLVRLVYADLLGVDLPIHQYEYIGDAADRIAGERAGWTPVADPQPLDVAVVDAIFKNHLTGKFCRGPHHLALYLGEGRVMSAIRPTGVVVQRQNLKLVMEWLRHE